MLDGFLEFFPDAQVGKILIQRNEESRAKEPHWFYEKLPRDIGEKKRVFVLDPMCGTGGSASLAIRKLKERGVQEERITFVNLMSCEQGLTVVTKAYPRV